jgi:integrase-like protein
VELGEFFDSWLNSKHKLAPSTRRRYLDIGRMYIKPSVLGRMFVADIHISTTTAAVRTQ